MRNFTKISNRLAKFLMLLFAVSFISFGLKAQTPNTLACNDTVRISMEDVCEALITPDMVLEGDHYIDYSLYTVIIYDPDGNPIGNIVTSEYVGMILPVDVYFEQEDNRCSGFLKIEDYYPPVFNCEPATTTCAGDVFPGSLIPQQLAYNVTPEIDSIPDDQVYSVSITIPVQGLTDALLTDLDVIFDISHSAVYDLSASITSPGGATINLFNKPGNAVNCTGDNLHLRFDDDAVLGPIDLDNLCDTESPAVSGTFQPLNPLSILNGTDINGDWVITITDDSPIDGGVINLVTLGFSQTGGYLALPLPDGATWTYEGTNIFTAYDFDACGPVVLTYEDQEVPQDCSSPYSSIIYRSWTAVDPSGNTAYCTQTIYVLNNRITFLTFPPNFDDVENESLECVPGDDFYPDPDITGFPSGELCEDIQVTYEDLRIDICPGTFKVLRTWLVVDWCSGEIIEHIQVIKVLDDEGPVIDTPIPNIEVSTESLNCETDVDLHDPFDEPSMILYDCRQDEITYEVSYKLPEEENGVPSQAAPWIQDDRIVLVDDGDGNFHYVITDLPLGTTWVKYEFFDPCENETEATFEIIVTDIAEPIAVCDEHTQVSLGTDGIAKVSALTFDDGSHDACSSVEFEARRMVAGCGSDTEFRDSILFCCDDIGTIQMVELKVTDESNNSSTCMVEVVVVDKFPPLLICPQNLRIDCREDYRKTEITGFAEAYDNCGVDTIIFADNENIDACGSGYVYRTWYAVDVNGLTSTCLQVITVDNFDPFNEEDITWPDDITLVECESNTSPDVTGHVLVDDDLCSMVAITYKDQVFNIVEDACIKILRRWSVVDWCTFNDDEPYSSGYWEHTQVIKLMNSVAPEFEEDCVDLSFCSYGQCEGQIDFIKVAHDDCTPDQYLRWEHHIDLFNDGVFEFYGIKSNDASGTYPDGIHRIAWTVEDGCGNMNTCEQLFEVVDCKNPTPLCISQLATVVMNNNGMVTICAEDFDLCGLCDVGSYDNCTAQEDLIFSFSADVSDTCRTLTCDDIPNGESAFIHLEMWVTDEAGNQDYCDVTLDLQDNEGDVCLDTVPGAIIVSGMIQNPEHTPLPGVEIMLENQTSSIGFPLFNFTNNSGAYAFDDLYDHHEYLVTPSNDNDAGQGVSTLDLIYIQRHLLGLQTFDSPFALIAADADNNERITAGDLLSIRKLILGVTDGFSNGQTSWRFVSDWEDFITPDDPFPFLESINTSDFKELVGQINFTGVKIGDIDNSSAFNGNEIESRTKDKLIIVTDNQTFEPGSLFKTTFRASDLSGILGSQFTIEFNSDVINLTEVLPASDFISIDNFGMKYTKQGLLTFSWNTDIAIDEEDQALFTLVFSSISSGNVNETMRITDRITASEAYDQSFRVMDVELRFEDGDQSLESKSYTLHQNIPNPFSDITEIYFELPESSDARIMFYDLTGNMIMKEEGYYKRGLNKIEISKNDLQVSGIIYYTLETGAFTQTKKMICIN